MSATGENEKRTLKRAAALRAPLVRAGAIARANGIGYVLCGALTLGLGGLSDLSTAGLAAFLLVVGISTRSAGARLRAGDPASPATLARNEALLLLAIVAYCIVQMLGSTAVPSQELAMLGEAVDMDIESLVGAVRGVVYAGVMAISLVYQGGMALYFGRRAAMADLYVDTVPQWAREAIGEL